jgi:Na+-transporting methylmalonyl-CoA/oxaloacetate decarboxylase gamma subunit
MNESLIEATRSLVLGMGTVFAGLLLLLVSMKLIAMFVSWSQSSMSRSSRKAMTGSAVKTGNAGTAVVTQDGDSIVGEVLAAITMAIRLDDLALEDMEAQNLTWTRMFKPFSPWVMDSKTSLHTHRIRYHAPWNPGQIIRDTTQHPKS